MDTQSLSTYASVRREFVGLCADLDLAVERFEHPERGPWGEALSTDVCWQGPVDAEAVLVLVSGTHGPEGLAGSACQRDWLSRRESLPDGMALLVVHLINPYGCAWRRRQTEDNVDLNRNFVDFSAPLPVNEVYPLLHPLLLCPEWDGPQRQAARAQLARLRQELGETAFVGALTRGQYQFAEGVGFGGTHPTWSRRILEDILRQYLSHARRVGVIDFHTGIGPFGEGMLIAPQEGSGPARAAKWLEEPVMLVRGPNRGIPYELTGDLASGIERALPNAQVTGIALEFGTYELDRMLDLLIADCWVHNHGDPNTAPGCEIRAQLQEFFYPGTQPWLDVITERARSVIGRFLAGLAQTAQGETGTK